MASAAAARARATRAATDVATLEVAQKRSPINHKSHKHRHSYAKPVCLFLAGLAILIPLVAVGNYSHSRSSIGTVQHRDANTLYPTFEQEWHSLPTPYSLDTRGLTLNNETVTVPLGDLRAQLQGLQSGYNCSKPEPLRRESYIVCRYTHVTSGVDYPC